MDSTTGFRFLLVGKSGSGKSSTGNTILGEKKFEVHEVRSFSSRTQQCEVATGRHGYTSVQVMDTPGFFDTQLAQEDTARRITESLRSWCEGPDAVVIVIAAHQRYAREDYAAYETIKQILGENVTNHSVIVFTGGDIREHKQIEHDLFHADAPARLRQVLKECDNRYIVFNNKATEKKVQVECLLEATRNVKKPSFLRLLTTGTLTQGLVGLHEGELEREKYCRGIPHRVPTQETATASRTSALSTRYDEEGGVIEEWGKKEGLSSQTIKVLLDENFTTLNTLRELEPDDVKECFDNKELLPKRDYIQLKKAIGRLTGGGGTSCPPEVLPSQQPQAPSVESAAVGASSLQTSSSGVSNSGSIDAPDVSTGNSVDVDFRFLLVGKTGSGKSTSGNTIFGEDLFPTFATFSSVTPDCQLKRSKRRGRSIEIMELPGLYDTRMSQEDISTTVIQSVAGLHPGPHAVLYVVRLGRFSEEEYGAYRRLKALFDETITKYMIVLFTGGDELERTKTTLDSLMAHMPENLKTILEDCENRLVVFNNTATDPQPQVEDLLRMVERMKMANRSPYVCPKYKKIGEGMEEEIAKRLAVVDERELERQKYVQDLTKQIDEAKEDLRKKKEEFETQEQLRKEEAERLKEHEKKMKEIQEKQLDDEKRRKEEAQEKERLAEELKNLKKSCARAEAPERTAREDREAEIAEHSAKARKAKELEESKRKRPENVTNGTKDEIVTSQREQPGLFQWLGSAVDKVVWGSRW